MPVSAFLASSGVTAQCQQLELLVLPLQPLPGAAQGKEGILGINRNGNKRGHEHRSYFGAAAPKNQLLGCFIQTP